MEISIYDRIKTLAEQSGLSIREVEDSLDFSRNYLYSWKSKAPSIDKVIQVATFFNVSVDYLLGLKESKITEIPDENALYKIAQENELKKLLKTISQEFLLTESISEDGKQVYSIKKDMYSTDNIGDTVSKDFLLEKAPILLIQYKNLEDMLNNLGRAAFIKSIFNSNQPIVQLITDLINLTELSIAEERKINNSLRFYKR